MWIPLSVTTLMMTATKPEGGEGQLAPLASRDEGTKTPLPSEPGNPFFTLARPRLIVRLERSLPCCHTVKKNNHRLRGINKLRPQSPPPSPLHKRDEIAYSQSEESRIQRFLHATAYLRHSDHEKDSHVSIKSGVARAAAAARPPGRRRSCNLKSTTASSEEEEPLRSRQSEVGGFEQESLYRTVDICIVWFIF